MLRREAGMLADDVRILPQQVAILTGLSVDALKERRRPPPLPEPRERAGNAVWYSMASVRHYRRWLAEQANIGKAMGASTSPASFSAWLNTAAPDERWPIALVGATARQFDFWATVRGEASIGRKDSCGWLSATEYAKVLSNALKHEAAVRAAESLAGALGRSQGQASQGRDRL